MTRPPKFTPPPGTCDSHIHVYGDPAQIPLLPIHGWEMEPHFLDGYIAVHDALGLSRTAIIQTLHYDNDNSSMLHSISALGPGNASGVAVKRPAVTEAEIETLHEGGVRGLRFGIERAQHAAGAPGNRRRTDHAARMAHPILVDGARPAGACQTYLGPSGGCGGRSYWQHSPGIRNGPSRVRRALAYAGDRPILGKTVGCVTIVENGHTRLFGLSNIRAGAGRGGTGVGALGDQLAPPLGRFNTGSHKSAENPARLDGR